MDVRKGFEDISDKTEDILEKAHSPSSRSGHTVERVAKMDAAGVDHEVIALQLTKNSRYGNSYEPSEVPTLLKVHEDNVTAVGITAAQARQLIRDQQDTTEEIEGNWSPAN